MIVFTVFSVPQNHESTHRERRRERERETRGRGRVRGIIIRE